MKRAEDIVLDRWHETASAIICVTCYLLTSFLTTNVCHNIIGLEHVTSH